MELIATAWCIFTIVVGARGASFWWILALAVGSSFIYAGLRREHAVRFWSTSKPIFAQWLAMTYVTQVLTMGVLFLIGFGIGKLF